MNTQIISKYLMAYLSSRPLFLSLIRSLEASLYNDYLLFKGPVLDVGCGDGFFAETVFGHVDVGLDVSDSRMNEARQKNVYGKLVAYDGRIFPFKNGTFKSVVSNCVFEHIPDIELLVSEIHRVLKPGGRLITTVMAKPWDDYLFGTLIFGNWYTAYMRKKQVHLNLYSMDEWDRLFAKSKFRIVQKTGYLDKSASRLMDISHYLSVPSLISYTLTGKWVLWPWLGKIYPIQWLTNAISHDIGPDQSAGIFYVLEKRK